MIHVAIAGAAGRTGRFVLDLLCGDQRFALAAALTRPGCSAIGSTIKSGATEALISEQLDVPADVLIDFTVGSGTHAWLEVCRSRKIPMVIGATGHSEADLAQIQEASGIIPIVKASNFSRGIEVIRSQLGRVAAQLGEEYDIEIVEIHHRHKVDAPSGTALALADELLTVRGWTRENNIAYGRRGGRAKRQSEQLGIHSIRMGGGISEHEIHFSCPGETITIRHSVHSREPYAVGALCAAQWVVAQAPGLYSMSDVNGAE